MMFRRPSVRYGRTPEPETPYQRAAQVWDERIGSARVQAQNWRLIAFGNLFLALGLLGCVIWQSARGTVTPWVVEVNKLGETRAVAPATVDYQPTDPQIEWHLARFIEDVRSLPIDPVIVRVNWLRASPGSFRVAWVERRYENASLAATERWTAILTIVVEPPRDAERLRKKPLGVFVDAVNWSKEFG